MSTDFRNSETKENLMRAFAGESQARNRYTFAASQARKSGLHVIEAIFTFTRRNTRKFFIIICRSWQVKPSWWTAAIRWTCIRICSLF